MGARVTILIISLSFFAAAAGSQELPKRSTDTLWIDSIGTHSGQAAVLEIGFANADTVNAIDLPITYGDPAILIDSVSFAGSRIEDVLFTIVDIDTSAAICHIGAILDFLPGAHGVGPGSGLLGRIHLQIPDDYPNQTIHFDTIRLQTGLTFVDVNDQSYVPIFEMGIITNTHAPALDDSIWVDDIDVSSGEQFAVPVQIYNQHPLYNVRLPLEYPSDNIVFDSATFDGTRADHAILADAVADNAGKRMLLSLGFDAGNLLPSGSGPIAILHFTCLFSGVTSAVALDTTDQYLAEYYCQLGPIFQYVRTYPGYSPGIITIDLSTDVDDDNRLALPEEYSLDQNVPNPFNPTTSMAFAIPERCHVLMEVFNVLGQKVRILVNEIMPAGHYTVAFDSRDNDGRPLASGIYMYRIKTKHFTQSRKMLLVK